MARPLAGLGAAADRAGAGDLTVRAAEEGPAEVRVLAGRFNDMVGRLDELVRSQEAFVADASHQLRTPLAALRLRLENLERDVAVEGRDGLERALAEVARLSRLVDGLLALARADAVAPAGGPADLAALADDRVAFWSALAEERGVRLVLAASGPVPARATPGRVVQVLDNLIENALDASPVASTVTVAAGLAGGRAELRVVDEGPGLTPEQRQRAFDRFWRAGPGGEGSGLGLAIVARLVQADGGTAELRASTTGGVEAVVGFPSS
ncbi:MAG: HAMP domain-containing sensor histidine kinase [Thermoleophilia bacterium]